MTPQEHIAQLKELPSKVERLAIERIIVPAGNRMLASIINRNANEGKNTDGSKRTGYSTKPAYVGRNKFVVKSAFKPVGKTGKKTKTMYVGGGYFQLRQIQGRRTDIKNYEYSGDTIKAFQLKTELNGAVIGFVTQKASDIRKGNDKRNGEAWKPSMKEIEDYKKEVTEQSKELNRNILFNVV